MNILVQKVTGPKCLQNTVLTDGRSIAGASYLSASSQHLRVTCALHPFERRENELSDMEITEAACAYLHGIHPLHSAEVADALRRVSQVVAFIVDAVGRLFATQVLLQLVLGSSVGSKTQRGDGASG